MRRARGKAGARRRLEDELARRRQREFVGRATEIEVFERALHGKPDIARVFHVSGIGGVGKTSLLHAFANACRRARVRCAYVDARNLEEATPEGFLRAVRSSLGLRHNARLFPPEQPHVLLVDTLEAIRPLEYWLAGVFLPALPTTTIVVLAGRHASFPRDRPELGWRGVVRPLALANFTASESERYLTLRNVPTTLHPALLQFSHGHPLALALVGDHVLRTGMLQFDPAAAANGGGRLLETLLEALLEDVDDPAQRAALEACSVVRAMTESLLAAMMVQIDAQRTFRWLAKRPFIDGGPDGLFLHDSAREVLFAELRWRNPERHMQLAARAQRYYLDHISPRAASDVLYLHRHNPVLRPLTDWSAEPALAVGVATDRDVEAILAIVTRYEGAESARLAAHWLARQRSAFLVMHDARGRLVGFTAMLALEEATRRAIESDPGMRAAAGYVRKLGIRGGHTVVIRFAMAHDTYQEPSAVMSLVSALAVRHIATTPRVALALRVFADMERWLPVYRQLGGEVAQGFGFRVGERVYGMFGVDFRELSPLAWLDGVLQRSSGAAKGTNELPRRTLDRAAFADALREALRDLGDPHALAANPLLSSRLVGDRAKPSATSAERTVALVAIIRESVTALGQVQRHAHFGRALESTYLEPAAATQEQIAKRLGVPFRTYRDHLVKGIAALVERIWQRERELGR